MYSASRTEYAVCTASPPPSRSTTMTRIKLTSPCREKPAVSSQSGWAGPSCTRNRKTACQASRSAPMTVIKFNSSRNMPNRANSIFCWCSCSTVLADEPKKRLSWSNGSSTTAFRSGASTKVNSESTRMSTVSPTTSASGRQTVRVRKPPCVPRLPSADGTGRPLPWRFRPLRL